MERAGKGVLYAVTESVEQASPDRRPVAGDPECGGCLWQVEEQGPLRFRCHVGHAYYSEALLGEQAEALEAALWTATRTFRERCVLARQSASSH